MTTLIAMQTGLPGGTASLPGGSQAYTITGGVAQVNPVDVPAAQRAGWKFSGGAELAYSGAQVRAMTPPSTSVLAPGATVTFPDGQTATLTGGVVSVPAQFVRFMEEQRWSLVGASAGA